MSQSPTGSPKVSFSSGCGSEETPPPASPSADDLLDRDVQLMIHGEGYKPKPLRSWRRCPLIQASRKAEFRSFPDGTTPEIRHLPEHVRASLNGCKLFQPQQIAEYNDMLRQDGKLIGSLTLAGGFKPSTTSADQEIPPPETYIDHTRGRSPAYHSTSLRKKCRRKVSGVDVLATRARVKPGRLYHKFDSLCALATSKAGRLLLVQHRILPHVFYAIRYDPAHKLYIDLLNEYERRWFAVSPSYGKDEDCS